MLTNQTNWTPPPIVREKALTRAWIVFKDGGKTSWVSLDSSGRYHVESPREYGIRGLKTRIKARYGDKLNQVELYDNQTDEFIEKWVVNGRWVV